MNRFKYVILTLLLGMSWTFVSCTSGDGERDHSSVIETDEDRQYYQLKVYTFDNQKQVQVVDQYLENAFLPALKKVNMTNVGVFKSRLAESDSALLTYVLIPLKSLDQILAINNALEKDQEYLSAGREYLDASHNEAPYRRIETTLLRAFSDMPLLKLPSYTNPRSERVYELRSYESATEKLYKNKVEMFNGGGEVKLFESLGFNAVFFADVIVGADMPNLMYMTTFDNLESRDAHWKTFGDSPGWKKMSQMPKYANNMSHADIFLLYPTEYSDY